MNKRVLVFIIAYNEEKTIASVINEVRIHAPYADIIVVDDCSSDQTRMAARQQGVSVVTHLVNSRTSGYAAVRTAMIYAYKNGYDICCQIDGDGQHNAAYLKNILAPIINNQSDLVIGSRFNGQRDYKFSVSRYFGIRIFSFITSIILGKRIRDISSGFKAVNIKIIDLFANYPFMLTDTNEMLIVASRHGMRILEVPVNMRMREFGKSSLTLSRTIIYPLRTVTYIITAFVSTVRVNLGMRKY